MPSANRPTQALITLLSTPNYLPGVACLAASLRETGSVAPLVVAVGAGVGPEAEHQLERLPGVDQVLRLRAAAGADALPRQGHHWDNTFEKLDLFGLEQFSKLVYLDSDMVALAPVDELFDAPHMAAVDAGRLVEPGWTRLNSGLMVIEPDASLPRRMAERFQAAAREAAQEGRPAVGDQDLINDFYADWPEAGPHLDQGYNVLFDHLEAYLASGEYVLPGSASSGARTVKIVHFTGRDKPWMPRGRLRNWLARLAGRLGAGQAAVLRGYERLLRQAGGDSWSRRLGLAS
jgi:glycogenin